MLTDEEITLIVRECARGSAINRDGSTSHRIARAIESAVLAKLREQKPVEIDWPDYHYTGMGCGLEDRNITNRYEAMAYGWDCAIDAIAERIPEELFEHPAPIPEGWRSIIVNFIHQFKRHVGGDGEFWLHELEDFYNAMAAARSE